MLVPYELLEPSLAIFGLIAAGVSAAAQSSGASKNRKFIRRQTLQGQQFQERMSNTAYQRSMADMRKAGLNPILAYQQGGASTPTATHAGGGQSDNSGQALASGLASGTKASLASSQKNLNNAGSAESGARTAAIPYGAMRDEAMADMFDADIALKRRQEDLLEMQKYGQMLTNAKSANQLPESALEKKQYEVPYLSNALKFYKDFIK